MQGKARLHDDVQIVMAKIANRIKYLEISGKTTYSPEVFFESDAEKVTFYPKIL
jgi:hypothetical protein